MADSIMDKVLGDLAALSDNSINLLKCCALIRATCIAVAEAIPRAALASMTETEASQEIEGVERIFFQAYWKLKEIIPDDKKAMVCTTAVDAARQVAREAIPKDRRYRADGWVFAVSTMANQAASRIMMEVHYKYSP